jgi:hypothetical protein
MGQRRWHYDQHLHHHGGARRVCDRALQVTRGENDAYPSCLEALAELAALDGGWLAHLSEVCLAVAAELAGDQPVATAQGIRWIRFCRRSLRLMLPCGIRGAARLSARAGDPDQSVRLWATAEHIEAVTHVRYMPLMERLDRPLRQQCVDGLGPDATARLIAEGTSLSTAEATQAPEDALLGL